MTPVQAAARLGVHETAVRTVEERENDAVVTLRDGTRMLVSTTVARPYVPEIDDEESVAEANRIDREMLLSNIKEPDDGADEETEKPKTPAKRTQGKAK